MEIENEIGNRRKFLRTDSMGKWGRVKSDQKKRLPAPLIQKPYPKDAKLIGLIAPERLTIGKVPLIDVIRSRKSRRTFIEEPLNLEELSFLLWATQGIHSIIGNGQATRRTVPSGGARHPFETYLCINNVKGLKPGLYRYLAVEHKLCLLCEDSEDPTKIIKTPIQKAPVIFIWTVIPYRSEWRYGLFSHKTIVQDSGHLCQNLYLASEAIGGGTCAVGAYIQKRVDEFIGVDGEEEFTIYVARVGKVKQDQSSEDHDKVVERIHGYRVKKNG